jgi:hypothetical protein
MNQGKRSRLSLSCCLAEGFPPQPAAFAVVVNRIVSANEATSFGVPSAVRVRISEKHLQLFTVWPLRAQEGSAF